MKQNDMTTKEISMNKDARKSRGFVPHLRHALIAVMMLGAVGAKAQTSYVFYNGTYGYLYNDNGTLKSSTSLQFDKSSVWVASGEIGGNNNRTIQSYTSGQYLGNAGSLNNTSSNWRGSNNYLCYRSGNQNYYLKATSATTFTTNSNQENGNRYNYYTVTVDDYAQGLSDFSISGGVSSFNTTGSATYTHTNAEYTDKNYTHYNFNGDDYYVDESNVTTTTLSTTTISSASNYSWSLSDNVAGYATVDSSTGEVTVSSIPTSGNLVITLTCTVTYDGQSATATKNITLSQTGVSGGTVTIDDREDHTWTYYSGVDASVDGGNYNSDYAGKLYSPNPRNVKITYKANGGAVSIDESETEFVYYKTLEEGTTSGQYPYTVISNPFSKRPNGMGFGGWRIKEGADYISGYADEAILPLDADIVFTNLPYPSVNCTSAEIELEATWVSLNNIVRRTQTGNYTYSTTGGTYETNILVIQSNQTGTITTSSPVTIMMVEPDGSADYRGTYTFTGNITPNNNGVTKIEFTRWNSQNTVNAGYRNLWIGRGMTTTSRCANLITGYNGTGSVASPQYSIKVESGIYQYFDFYKGHSTYDSGTSNTGFTVSGTAANAKITMGNDYDRAKGANATLEFIYGPMFGYSGSFSDRGNRDNKHTLDLTVKSGTIGSTFFMEDTNTATYLQGGAGQCMYLSSAGSQTNVGTRNVIIEGGDICSIGGGIDSYNNAPSNNNTPNTTTNYERLSFNLRIKGGTIHGNVYGGAAKSPAGGNRIMVMTGGQVKGWFAAGCNGTDDDGGQTYGTSYVYIGGNSSVNSEASTKVLGYANGGNVYAAGAGRQGATSCGEMTFGTNLVIADDSYIERGIYGGGNYGYALAETNIYITGGTNEGNDGTVNGVTTNGGVYGGANQQDGPGINMYMTGGTMKGGVYGGCNTRGTISGSVTMNINGGQVGTTSATANIHGGGYGPNTVVSQNVDITLGATGQTTQGVTVYGDVYGGSALGDVNGTAATNTYHTNVTMNKGVINGSLYGGALGDASTAANVYGPVAVKVYGGTVNTTSASGSGAVYGCNNVNGAPQRAVTVDIYGTDPAPSENTYALDAVYGGGNQANYSYGTPTVTVHGCDNSIGYVYGGGNAAHITNGDTDVTIYGGNKIGNVFGGGNGTVTPANVSGDTNVKIYGGTILKVFGGSNSQGNIGGSINVTAQSQTESGGTACPMNVDELYGGGNMANSNVGNITIGCMNDGDIINNVYGGANQADITGNISLTMTGGRIGNLFGGNNTSGDISGSIAVNVNWDGSCPNSYLGNVFGGGNHAAYPRTPSVNIINGTVSHNVYGGGNEAGVGGTAVNVSGGSVLEGIYGGCNTSGTVTGDVSVNITGGTIGSTTHKANVHGGGYGSATETEGNVDVTINGAAVNIYGDVYGGSALGNVNSDTDDYTHVLLTAGTIYGDVYGGGLGDDTHAALVNGNVTVTQNGVAFVKATTTDDDGNTVVTAGRIFGCNNLNGSPQGTVLVLVNKTARADGGAHQKSVHDADGNITTDNYEMQAVYGGGNLAAYNPAAATLTATGQFTEYLDKDNNTIAHTAAGNPLQVVVNGCDDVSVGYIYGGGNAAPTPSTDVVMLGAYEVGFLFGGGNGKDKYTRDGGTTWHDNPGADVGINGGTLYGNGNANTTVLGGTIHEVYGASNQKGNIKGSINLRVQEDVVACPMVVDKIVGAGKNADIDQDVNMVMGCMPTTKTALVFGGADNANVNGHVDLTITSGTFGKVFGGNNLSGMIKGYIKVNIEETGCTPIRIDELYLGGNQAAYSVFGYNDNGTCKTEGTAIYEQPVLNVISCTYIGKVFGGGLGVGAAMYANPTVNINMTKGAFYSAVPTNDGNNADQLGAIENVYGGGNEAAVHGNTLVNIGTEIGNNVTLKSTGETKQVLGAYITGTVYGAGKGTTSDIASAVVAGNTRVNMAGGRVCRSIYGGGELGSVGTFTQFYDADVASPYHKAGEPKACKAGTGLAEVIITGGTVGLNNQLMPDPANPTSEDDYGYVFCASKGEADSVTYSNANALAVVNNTHLQISGGLIIASVYGGSENGQVLDSTLVEISGGQIGTGHYKEGDTHRWDGLYDEADWTTAINKIKAGTFTDADAAGFHECDAWPFGAEGQRYIYDPFADAPGYDAQGGSKSAGNGHSFYGNVFGGGSGYYPFAPGQWRATAGRVNGNTRVVITGGHVLTNVYGGNEISDVVGKSTVHMSGGTVGVPRSHAAIAAHPVNSYIFGAGMGDPRVMFNGKSNVGSSEVIVSDNAFVFGSVFGGGEDGHVLGDAKTTIKGNAHIGTFGDSSVDGNLFGSGRGFSAMALTAGVVCGNVNVVIQDNAKLLGSVFGGGRLAAVGTYLAEETDTEHYGILQSGDDHGNVTINITGGTIGNKDRISTSQYSIGDVFGGSKGAILDDWQKNQALGLVKNTTVNISEATGTTTIYGNVYGGGEIASVGSYTYANATQAAEYSAAHAPEEMTVGDVHALRDANTGLAVINITGGTIGQNSLSDTKGSVFGGCLGKSGTEYSGYSFVNNSQVTIDGATIYGCVFGGGENGHVYSNTDVKIKSGTVGIPLDNVADADIVPNMIYRGNVYGGGRGVDKTSLNDYSLTAGKVNGNTNVTVEGGTIYRCVYGGGSLASVGMRGVAATDKTHGIATVVIKGGKIGTDGGASANDYTTLIPVRTAERENGYVYGSGRGMAAGADANATVVNMAYTRFTNVSIEGDAHVTGSVFGGGENGHVKYDTEVYVKEDCLVGTELTAQEHAIDDNGRGRLIYRANVYGSGRGLDVGGDDNYSLTAGRVYGNTFVEVSGGKIYHDVFGGGSLASVGNETVDAGTGEVTYGDDSGLTKVYIKGGVIGYSENEDYWGFNCGFVYGGCRGLAAEPNSDIVKMAYVHEAEVYIEPGADIKGSVFGGGANGHVKNDTKVVISGGSIGTALKDSEVGFDDHGVANAPVFRGNVYAGGRGVDMYQKSGDESYSMTAGAVYGNADLIMTGGHVWHNVYGSGAMASVGTVKEKPSGTHVHDEIVDAGGTVINPDGSEVNYLTGVFEANTGKVTVTITGGTVGDTTPGHEGRNNGRVYGAGRGVSANRSDLVASMEYVNDTWVTIGTEGQQPSAYSGSTPGELNYPYIYGAVFGGGENGHVKTDTHVTMHSGIIGWPLDEGASGQHKTAADGASKNPFRGHIFGGGRGVDPLYHSSSETRSSTAGRVYGHTYVNMTGGLVRRAIYGGGLLASVGMYQLAESDLHIVNMIEDEVNGGDAQINISGGIIGNVNPDGSVITDASTSGFALLAPGDNNGHVFGSSCGMVADNYVEGGVAIDLQYRQMGYSHSTHVNITGGHMFGSIFGSGENGHVWEDSRINISGGEIGSETSDLIYCGNVYGSGRGVDHPHAHISETAGKVRGNTTVNMTGGIVWRDVYGGGSLASVGESDETAADSKKNVTSDLTTNNPFPYSTGLTRVIIDGESKVHGSVYGSGRGVASANEEYKQAAYVKNTLVTVTGNAHVWKNVFGGGNAGHVRKNTDVTIDGSAKVDGNVYGGGAGSVTSPTAGLVNHDVTVNIKNGLIAGDVYGGGAIANTNVHDVRNDAGTNPDQASAYGNTCSESTRGHCTTAVNLLGGIILGNAYGGGQGVIPADGATAAEIANSGAMVRGDVTVTLNGTGFMLNTGQDDQGNDIATSGRVFGGNNLNGSPQGTVLVHVLQTKGVTKSGDTYTLNDSKPTKGTDTYEVEAVYGGGNLAAYHPWASDEEATGQFTAYSRTVEGTVTSVAHNAVKQPLQVVIEGCDETSINYVYGGGNAAAAPSTDVLVVSCYEVGNVFGGGNGKDRISKNGVWSENPGANVGYLDDGSTYGTGEALASVVGGTVGYTFGGSNTKGNIRTSAKVFLDEASDCPLKVGEVYGGGNEAYMEGDSKIELGCITTLGVLYGGARNADIDGDIEMTISSGHFGRVFGGNNLGGTINGSITLNVEETGCNPITIGELYGCGNNAPYVTPAGKPDPSVNLKSFTSIGRVFGGGYGAGAVVTGNTTVNVNLVVGDKAAVASPYAGTTITYDDGTSVDLPAHTSGKIGVIGTVFGGGNAAKVAGNTNVNIGTLPTITYVSGSDHEPKTVVGADIIGNVFGGGNAAEVTGNTNVTIGEKKMP